MKNSKLRLVRKQKGYSQQELADIIPTEVSNYSRKENGYIKISPKEWEKIASFLNVSVDEIKEDNILGPMNKYEILEAENEALRNKIKLLKIQLEVIKSIIS